VGNRKDRKHGLPYNNLEVFTNAKGHFLSLCEMYEHMGKLINLQAQNLRHAKFSKTTAPTIGLKMTEQYNEMGEELKNIGAYLDLMPGKNVLLPEEPEGKDIDVEVENEVFVSNIEPEGKDENND